MPQEQLDGSEILRPLVISMALVSRSEWVPYSPGSNPIRATQAFTIRAYRRVEICGEQGKRLGKRN